MVGAKRPFLQADVTVGDCDKHADADTEEGGVLGQRPHFCRWTHDSSIIIVLHCNNRVSSFALPPTKGLQLPSATTPLRRQKANDGKPNEVVVVIAIVVITLLPTHRHKGGGASLKTMTSPQKNDVKPMCACACLASRTDNKTSKNNENDPPTCSSDLKVSVGHIVSLQPPPPVFNMHLYLCW